MLPQETVSSLNGFPSGVERPSTEEGKAKILFALLPYTIVN